MSRLHRASHLTSIGLLVLSLVSASAAGSQREGLAEEASRYRMSEMALQSLTQIAELQTGVTVLSYQKDGATARYHPSYSSSVCPIGGATRLQALVAAGKRDIERELLSLRAVADSDNSGFLSDEEAKIFFEMVEFGLRLNYLEMIEGDSAGKLAGIMGMPTEDLLTRAQKYADFVASAKQKAIVFASAPALK